MERKRTIDDLASLCREAAGSAVPIEYVGYRPGEEGQREAFSTAKARKTLGYAPRVSPTEAITLTADWVRSLGQSAPGEV